MNSEAINTVKALIEILSKYPSDTEISHLTGNKTASKETCDLYLVETHPIGGRDTEETLSLTFANTADPFD